MTERGMSLRGLARAASYDPSHLSKVLNGRKPYTPHLAARLDDALDPVFAHGISLREPAGPADVDFEEVE